MQVWLPFVGTLVLTSACRENAADGVVQDGVREARSPNNPRAADGRQRGPVAPRGNQRGRPDITTEVRSIDGTFNNENNPNWGSSNVAFIRRAPAAYGEGQSPSGATRANPRQISQAVSAEEAPRLNLQGVSDFVWQWGQFLDHDIDLTPEVDPIEAFDIAVPAGDAWFDPLSSGSVVMHFGRSQFILRDGVREQLNGITAYIDASNVYGSDTERATALRSMDGSGRLRTSAGNLLPFNTGELPNAAPPGRPASAFFLAGDFRANEQVGLTAMHTLFVREHNLWAERLAAQSPGLSGEELYQRARAIVAAEMQAITVSAFLPALLGPNPLPPYRGYDPGIDAGITNEFATAGYRFGHSMLSTHIQRLGADGRATAAGPLALSDAFFAPTVLVETGLDPLLRGLASQRARAVDLEIVDDVRNLLFGPPGAGGLDLASLNIQRGRDHGLPGFVEVRRAFGLALLEDFAALDATPETQVRLRSVYSDVSQVDPWVGVLAERPASGGLLGETGRAILIDQFQRLRDGDRFWYESYLSPELVAEVNRRTLATIIRENTGVGAEIPDDVFRVAVNP